MGTGVDAEGLWFRRSRWGVARIVTWAGMLVLLTYQAIHVFVLGDPWYDGLASLVIFALLAAAYSGQVQRRMGLPLRLTPDHLELTGPEGRPLAIDWSNLAVAEVRGRFPPTLVLEVVDRDRTRPVLNRWEWPSSAP